MRFHCLCMKSHLGLGKERGKKTVGSGRNFCLEKHSSVEQSVSENIMVIQILVIQTDEPNSI